MESTLGSRLRAAIERRKIKPAVFAREAKSTTATIANWMHDQVQVEHVKAVQLFRIADAARISARELLLGEPDSSAVRDEAGAYQSQPLQPEAHRMAIQLVVEGLAERDLELPPDKLAAAISMAYDLLVEGIPRAKVLRFVLAPVA